MNRNEDYKEFLKEKSEIIEQLKTKKTLIYDLFYPVMLVLDYLTNKDMNVEGYSKEEIGHVFDDGYNYLYNAFDMIDEIIRKILFNNMNLFYYHEKTIYYILRLDELSRYDSNNKIEDKIRNLYKILEQNKTLDKNDENEIINLIESSKNKEDETQNRFVIISYFFNLKLI